MTEAVTIVVPCYNEAERLDGETFKKLASTPGLSIVFVNDGSADATAGLIDRLAQESERVGAHHLAQNQGKAEAVRQGLLSALSSSDIVGYYDADLATPPEDLLAMLQEMRRADAEVCIGSRVKLLGRSIDRDEKRHYLGRVFATCASMVLRTPVYDTQCGAKLFRVNPALRHALEDRFISKWAFDVELLGRLFAGANPLSPEDVIEVPLRQWTDVDGSKLKPWSMVVSGLSLAQIELDLRRRRKNGL